MWNTLKSGVSEFVSTVKDDTLNVVGRGEGHGHEEASAPSSSERDDRGDDRAADAGESAASVASLSQRVRELEGETSKLREDAKRAAVERAAALAAATREIAELRGQNERLRAALRAAAAPAPRYVPESELDEDDGWEEWGDEELHSPSATT